MDDENSFLEVALFVVVSIFVPFPILFSHFAAPYASLEQWLVPLKQCLLRHYDRNDDVAVDDEVQCVDEEQEASGAHVDAKDPFLLRTILSWQ